MKVQGVDVPTNSDKKLFLEGEKGKTAIIEIRDELIKRTLKVAGNTDLFDPKGKDANKIWFFKTVGLATNFIVPIKKDLIVGRSGQDINLVNSSVSSHHCNLKLKDGILFVIDNKSTNGTYVGGHRLEPDRMVILSPNDKILIGQVLIHIMYEEEAAITADAKPAGKKDKHKIEITDKSGEKAILINDPSQLKDVGSNPFEKNDLPKKPKKKVINEESRYGDSDRSVSGFIIRSLAFISDLSISYFVYAFVQASSEQLEFLKGVSTNLVIELKLFLTMPSVELVLNTLDDFIPFLIVYYVIRFVATAILGVSIGQFMLGMRNDPTGLSGKLRAVLRELFGLFTSPLIIFDIPAVFRWRTFKELLSFTTLRNSSLLANFIGVFIFFPIFLSAGIFAPIIGQLSNYDRFTKGVAVEIRKQDQVLAQVSEEEITLPKTKLYSNNFRFTILKRSDGKTVHIPSFELTQDEKAKRVNPTMMIYDRTSGKSVELKLVKTFSFSELMSKTMRFLFFMRNNYPTIFEFINSSKQEKVPLMSNGGGESQKIKTQMLGADSSRFVKKAFELNAYNLPKYVEEFGPFLQSMVDFRTIILSLAGSDDISKMEIVYLKDIPFIRIDKKADGDPKEVILISLCSEVGLVYSMTIAGPSSIDDSLTTVFNDVEWYFGNEKPREFSFPNVLVSSSVDMVFSEYNIADYFADKDVSGLSRDKLDEYTFMLLFNTSRAAFIDKDMNLVAILKRVVGRYQTSLQELVVAYPERNKLLIKITELASALEKSDLIYFNVPKGK